MRKRTPSPEKSSISKCPCSFFALYNRRHPKTKKSTAAITPSLGPQEPFRNMKANGALSIDYREHQPLCIISTKSLRWLSPKRKPPSLPHVSWQIFIIFWLWTRDFSWNAQNLSVSIFIGGYLSAGYILYPIQTNCKKKTTNFFKKNIETGLQIHIITNQANNGGWQQGLPRQMRRTTPRTDPDKLWY